MVKLTTEEKNMLDTLTHRSKTDCWFWIDDEHDCIIDLENDNAIMDTAEAILELDDGIPDVSEFLDENDLVLYNNLLERCKK